VEARLVLPQALAFGLIGGRPLFAEEEGGTILSALGGGGGSGFLTVFFLGADLGVLEPERLFLPLPLTGKFKRLLMM
jgi:hypothetical protein